MPPASPISHIALKDFGCLRSPRGAANTFLSKNLIYGFNGSGKTTLSRVFASLQRGEHVPHLPAGASFEVHLANGQSFKSGESFDALRNRILVFNGDFIDANLRWTEGRLAPVFYIGEQQAGIAQELEAADAATSDIEKDVTAADRTLTSATRALTEHRRNAARAIEIELGLTRGYQAPQLEADYGSSFTEEHKLTSERLAELKGTIRQDVALPKLPLIGKFPDFADHLKQVRNIVASTIGSILTADLQGHEIMLPWLRVGLEYHEQHSLGSCLFCANPLSEDRRRTLAAAIDGRFKELTDTIESLRLSLETWKREAQEIETAIPDARDLAEAHRPAFVSAARALRERMSQMRNAADHCLELLKHKAGNPALRLGSELSSDEDLDGWSDALSTAIAQANAIIEQHNKAHDDFEEVRRRARDLVKSHLLFLGQEEYRNRVQAAADAQQATADQKERQRTNMEVVERLQAALRQHSLAVPVINGLIKGYLGHDDLQIAPLEEGYEIRRLGRNDIGRLSEGEKTAIALCYFISTLQAEQRKRDDLIVVIDDPISSLDTRALHYAFNLVRSSLSGVGQLFILTHNMYFMQEVKKWLKSAAYPKDSGRQPTARLLYLDPTQQPGDASRCSALCELPKLLRDYESEYQYLCHLVFKFVDPDNRDESHLLLIPNALRKVLEIFLAFKDPGTASIRNKIDELLAKGDYGIDPTKLRALERLAQVESHADNLDDLIGFSSMTVEESRSAAVALFDAMERVDPVHFERVQRICRP